MTSGPYFYRTVCPIANKQIAYSTTCNIFCSGSKSPSYFHLRKENSFGVTHTRVVVLLPERNRVYGA